MARTLHLQLILPDADTDAVARLAELIPGVHAFALGLEIPLVDLGAEEALALCLRCGVTCRGTRLVAASTGG